MTERETGPPRARTQVHRGITALIHAQLARELGVASLAVQMISRVREAMEVELALAAVYEKPVLSALADRILDLRPALFDP